MPGARTIRCSNGQWAVRFSSPVDGHVRTFRVTTYKLAAEAIARKVSQLLDGIRSNEAAPSEARDWVESLDPSTLEKLIRWGVVAKSSASRCNPVEDHIQAWKKHLRIQDKKPRRISELTRQVRTLLRLSGVDRLADLSVQAVEIGLERMRERKTGSAPATVGAHKQAIGQFVRWCIRQGLLSTNPLAGMESIKGGTERERRALSESEQRWILRTTHNGPTLEGRRHDHSLSWQMTGPERSLAYRLVLSTGLRANELRSLTRSSFRLASTAPTLKLKAEHEKSGRGYVWPLQPKLVSMLREHLAHLADLADEAPAFSMPPSTQTAKVIRADLATARQTWIDSAGDDNAERFRRSESSFLAEKTEVGRFDFHGLRVTYITNLARSGVPLHAAVMMARHTDPRLTTAIYTKLGLDDHQHFADKLPDLDFPESPIRVAATGTSATDALHEGGAGCPSMSPDVPPFDPKSGDEIDGNPLQFQNFDPRCPPMSPDVPPLEETGAQTAVQVRNALV